MRVASRNRGAIPQRVLATLRHIFQVTLLIAILLVLACGGSAPAPASTAAIEPTTPVVETPLPVTVPPAAAPAATPVKYSLITTTLEQPLASGISVPEIVDQVLPSIVEIRTGNGGGTGFVLTSDGLVVTNKHVVAGSPTARLRFTSGQEYTATVSRVHPTLDLAYLTINPAGIFQPIQAGNSNQVRVGEQVVIVGFPIGATLGAEPTVSMGIISAKRDGLLQTDAPLNPGNSGGPMLDSYGNVIGVIKSRIDESQGATIAGIGFAIPINQVDVTISAQVAPTPLPPALIPTAQPTDSPVPALAPTIDVAATKTAIDTQLAIAQTKVAHDREIERQNQEAAAYAVSAAATAVAQIPTHTPRPTSTPTPEPTATPIPPSPTPLPTATPHPVTYCEAWEKMVLEWIYQGNIFQSQRGEVNPNTPTLPTLSLDHAVRFCIKKFPIGRLLDPWYGELTVGYGEGQLLPGTYQYITKERSFRVEGRGCEITLNMERNNYTDWEVVEMVYGEPFEFRLLTSHNQVAFKGKWGMNPCNGILYRIGD